MSRPSAFSWPRFYDWHLHGGIKQYRQDIGFWPKIPDN